ncbi:MAG: GNAT family N-acetyltransferase [Proteobacteria bacterium]|nr:GNAT family N-acetyltransferase [Pseudomonadota bacterium]
MSDIVIRQAEDPVGIEAARRLFRDYQAATDVEACFQSFEAELAGLPGAYVPPQGRLLIAWRDGEALGIVALKTVEPGEAGICEIKRLWVEPAARGLGLGRALAEAVIHAAEGAGCGRLVLETSPVTMARAAALYRALGFEDSGPYPGATGVEGIACMVRALKRAA